MRHDDRTTTQLQGEFVQWSPDKLDHNVCTLSRKGSLHAMGIVCSITSQSGRMTLQTFLLKKEKVQIANEIVKNKGIIIKE